MEYPPSPLRKETVYFEPSSGMHYMLAHHSKNLQEVTGRTSSPAWNLSIEFENDIQRTQHHNVFQSCLDVINTQNQCQIWIYFLKRLRAVYS